MKPIILALLVLSSGLAGLVLAQTAPVFQNRTLASRNWKWR